MWFCCWGERAWVAWTLTARDWECWESETRKEEGEERSGRIRVLESGSQWLGGIMKRPWLHTACSNWNGEGSSMSKSNHLFLWRCFCDSSIRGFRSFLSFSSIHLPTCLLQPLWESVGQSDTWEVGTWKQVLLIAKFNVRIQFHNLKTQTHNHPKQTLSPSYNLTGSLFNSFGQTKLKNKQKREEIS